MKVLDKSVQIIKNKDIMGEMLFMTAIIIELVVMMTDHLSVWTIPYRGRITHLAFVLFCIKIITTRYNIEQFVLIILCGILGVVSYITCGDEYVIRAVVMVSAAQYIDYKKVLKTILFSAVIGTAIIILLALLGICGRVVDIRDYGRGHIEARYCLGFNHANNVHGMLWYIVSIYALLYGFKRIWYDVVILTGLNILLYFFTISRTGVICTEIVLLGLLIVRYVPVFKDGLIIQMSSIPILGIIAFITIYGSRYNIVERRFVAIVDRILTCRVEMLSEHANIRQWELFPAERTVEMVDNGFSVITYIYGTAVGMFLIMVILFCTISMIKRREAIKAIVLIGLLLMLFMESTMIINTSLLCNMLLILLMKDNKGYERFANKEQNC